MKILKRLLIVDFYSGKFKMFPWKDRIFVKSKSLKKRVVCFMTCYDMVRYVVSCYLDLYYIMWCNAMQCSVMLWCVLQFNVMLCYEIVIMNVMIVILLTSLYFAWRQHILFSSSFMYLLVFCYDLIIVLILLWSYLFMS